MSSSWACAMSGPEHTRKEQPGKVKGQQRCVSAFPPAAEDGEAEATHATEQPWRRATSSHAPCLKKHMAAPPSRKHYTLHTGNNLHYTLTFPSQQPSWFTEMHNCATILR